MNNKTKKRGLMVTGLTLAILLMGTFAWQAFNQEALNVTEGAASNPGGRLHDDFDGTNKSVYVENYTPIRFGGDDIFVRIRLDEYMEYVDTNTKDTTILRGDIRNQVETPNIEDTTTWDTYEHKTYSYSIPSEECIRNYRELNFAQRNDYTYYMPTFNMDSQDLDAEINGTIEGDFGAGDKSNSFNDYVKYTANSHPEGITGTEVHYYNENVLYEDVLGYPVSPNADGLFTIENQTHHVQATQKLSSNIMSMEEWKALDYEDQIGDFWVYDVDGWAYYATGVSYETASGPLLEGLEVVDNPVGDWFYGVNVVSQMASKGDWGIAESEGQEATGMYKDGITSNALELLNKAAGILKVLKVEIKRDGETITKDLLSMGIGESLNLSADIQVLQGAGSSGSEDIEWSIEEISENKSGLSEITIDSKLVNGRFTPTLSMVGCTYRITATSILNTAMSDSVDVDIYRMDGIAVAAFPSNEWEIIQPGEQVKSVHQMTGFSGDTSVIWSLSGQSSEDTYINEKTGLLEVGADEELYDENGNIRVLTIRATSVEFVSIYGEYTLEVKQLMDMNTSEYFYGMENATLDSVVTIDGIDFYKIAEEEKNGRTAVLISTVSYNLMTGNRMHSVNSNVDGNQSGRWSYSEMKNTTLPAWLEKLPTLSNNAATVLHNDHISYLLYDCAPTETMDTEFYWVSYAAIPYDDSYDKAFILSVEEIYKYYAHNVNLLRGDDARETGSTINLRTRNIRYNGSSGTTNNSNYFNVTATRGDGNATLGYEGYLNGYTDSANYTPTTTTTSYTRNQIAIWIYL